MTDKERIKQVTDKLNDFELDISVSDFSYSVLHQTISERINFLLNANLPLVLSLLYRLDISERKLKETLAHDTGTPASDLIATMIIERQLQKIELKKSFERDSSIPEDERW